MSDASRSRLFAGRGDRSVTCIACGAELHREDAREYDRYGDRWNRTNKSFEYLCRPCDRASCHQPRDGLESTLEQAGAGEVDRSTFLRRFCDLTAGGDGAAADH